VLVVDHDEGLRELARRSLEAADFEFIEASDGASGIELVEHLRPDVVFLGFDLPDMMSDRRDEESIGQAFDAGATDYVVKPPHWAVLSHRVRYMARTRRANEALRRSEARVVEAQRVARVGWWEWDPRTDLFATSDEIRHVCGISFGATLESFLNHVHPDDRERIGDAIRGASQTGCCDSEFRIVGPVGEERIVHQRVRASSQGEEGAPILGTLQDVTERKHFETTIHRLSNFDGLTSLPNRQLFLERLDISVQTALRHERMAAVLFLDLDRFKRINDTLGHTLGDDLLRCVAERLTACIRKTDSVTRAKETTAEPMVARLGGDEFIILLSEIRRIDDAARVCRRLLESLSRPFQLNENAVYVTASIGIAVCPADGETGESLIKNADTAVNHIKGTGRNRYQFYTDSMNATALRRLVLESDLRQALAKDQLMVYFQPQIAVPSGRIVGAEALMRWRHPEFGFVSPMEFIPVAEESGMIIEMGEWILREACRQVAQWNGLLSESFRIAVNVSACQFREPTFVDSVERILRDTKIAASRLDVEVTESLLMDDLRESTENLMRLKALGVRLSVDDFGTGYSSLGYLNRLPLDSLKVDRSFLKGIPTDDDHIAIVRAIISLAHALKLGVVAEGVEHQDQLDFLQAEGCDELQGYLFSAPVPADQFLDFVAATSESTDQAKVAN
jgi:diguanylate cyclase (GGDEF)-like protein